MDLVLLIGNGEQKCQSKVEAWRDACRMHRFDCLVWTEWSEPALVAHPWNRTHVVALLDPSAVQRRRVRAIRRAAATALIVVSAPLGPPPSVGGQLECFLLQPGQESTLLSWCRRQLGERSSVQAIARPSGIVNMTERTLAIDGELLRLQPRETQLLAILASYTGATCHTDVACRELFGDADDRKRRLLRQYLYQLRQKLGRHSRLLQYVPGEGYRCLLELRLVEVA